MGGLNEYCCKLYFKFEVVSELKRQPQNFFENIILAHLICSIDYEKSKIGSTGIEN